MAHAQGLTGPDGRLIATGNTYRERPKLEWKQDIHGQWWYRNPSDAKLGWEHRWGWRKAKS